MIVNPTKLQRHTVFISFNKTLRFQNPYSHCTICHSVRFVLVRCYNKQSEKVPQLSRIFWNMCDWISVYYVSSIIGYSSQHNGCHYYYFCSKTRFYKSFCPMQSVCEIPECLEAWIVLSTLYRGSVAMSVTKEIDN